MKKWQAYEIGALHHVYVAEEVDALLHELRDLIQRCAGGHGASDHPCYRRDLCEEALALLAHAVESRMESGR